MYYQRNHQVYLEGGFKEVFESIEGCHPNHWFITLTSKRPYGPMEMSREVSNTLHRANRKLFGPAYSRKKIIRLATVAVQELTIDQGLHTHLLVGAPEGSLTLKAHPCKTPVPDLILATWISLDDRGKRTASAQNYRVITDFEGVTNYILKTLRTVESSDQLDLANTHLPHVERLSGPDPDNE